MTIKKLRNKGTGEIGYLYANKDVNYQVLGEDDCVLGVYDTLPRLIEEWEDYKLNIWYNSTISGRYTIEIDFATDKEAKKAMDKLKAWMRLKDKGFRFNGVTPMEYFIRFTYDKPRQILDNQQHPGVAQQFNNDLDLLFSGEDDQ